MRGDRVYCANQGSDDLTVIDAHGDTAVTVVHVGDCPTAMCTDSAANRLFCANHYSGEVSVIDCDSDSVVMSVSTGYCPRVLGYNSLGNKVYCANVCPRSVAVIDASSNRMLTSIPVGASPIALAFDSVSNKVYCANYAAGSVTAIDAHADSAGPTIAVGSRPHDLCVASDRGKVYCANYYSNSVSVIDVALDSVVRTIRVGSEPRYLSYCQVEGKVYCSNYGWESNSISVIDAEADTVLVEVRVNQGPGQACYNPTDNRVYVCSRIDRRVVAMDCITNMYHTIPQPSGPAALCYNPVNGFVYTCCYSSGDVCAIGGDTIVATIHIGPTRALACDPTRNKVYCLIGNGVVVVNGYSHQMVWTIPLPGTGTDILWVPGEGRGYIADFANSCIYVIRDSTPVGIVREGEQTAAGISPSAPTIFRNVLRIQGNESAILLDITGRCVMDLMPGENDVSRVAPGVYFVLRASGVERVASNVHKVVIQR